MKSIIILLLAVVLFTSCIESDYVKVMYLDNGQIATMRDNHKIRKITDTIVVVEHIITVLNGHRDYKNIYGVYLGELPKNTSEIKRNSKVTITYRKAVFIRNNNKI